MRGIKAGRWANACVTARLRPYLLLALTPPVVASAQWTVADTSGSVIINAVAGYTPNGYIGISSDLYLSTDAGATWDTRTPEYAGMPILGIWTDAHFASSTQGYMTGGFDFNNEYAILWTTDGGTNWIPVYSSNAGDWPRRYNALDFPTPSIGYAVGSNGRIGFTLTGGQTWANRASLGGMELTSLHFFDAGTGVVAGENTLVRTADGGISWTNALAVTGKNVLAASGNIVVDCGPGSVHISTNAGVDWITRTAPIASPRSVHVFSASEFVVVDADQDALYITHSGGQYWEQAVLPVVGDLQAVHFNNELNGCLVGKIGGRSLILTTSNGPGIGAPVMSIASTSVAACGSQTYTFQATDVDPSWDLTWYRNGGLIGTGPDVEVVFTANGLADVELRASNGLYTSSVPYNAEITMTQPFSVEATGDAILCSGGTATLGVLGAPVGATFSWQPVTGLSNPAVAAPLVSGLSTSQTYTVTVQDGPCSATDPVYIDQRPPIPPLQPIPLLAASTYGMYTFTDPYNGFVSDHDTIWATTDGGLSWTPRLVDVYEDWPSARLYMLDPFKGYVSNSWFLKVTTDGWNTYTTIPTYKLIQGNYRKLVYPVTRDTLLVACKPEIGSDLMLRSTDGGLSWNQIDQTFIKLRDVLAITPHVVLAGGATYGYQNGWIYRSIDAGATWANVETSFVLGDIAGFETTVDGSVYAITSNGIYRSTDLGITWSVYFQRTTNGGGGADCFISFQTPDIGFALFGPTFWRTINGGECWQRETVLPDAFNTSVSSIGDSLTFFQSGPSYLGPSMLYRTNPPAPGLRFTLNGDTICDGAAPLALNNSIGYDAFTWSIDGQVVSTDAQPVLPVLAVGLHTITLAGTAGGTTEQVTKSVFVDPFNVTPVLSLVEPLCWGGVMAGIQATTPTSVMGYKWYQQGQGAGLPVEQLTGGPILEVLTSSFPTSFYAIPVSRAGCLGNTSELIEIAAYNGVPRVYMPSGDLQICTGGQPTTTTYTTSPMGGATDIIDYTWTLTPPAAGVMTMNGASCSIQWDPHYVGSTTLSCAGIDTCGIGIPSARHVVVDTGNYITVQPLDIIVDIGDPFTLSVELAVPQSYQGWWYRNGVVAFNANTFTIQEAMPENAGAYFWRGNAQGVCEAFFSDTITVTVLGNVGIPEAPDGSMAIFPNPFTTRLSVEIPGASRATRLVLYDPSGRVLIDRDLPPGDRRTVEMNTKDIAAGTFILELSNGSWRTRTQVVKLSNDASDN